MAEEANVLSNLIKVNDLLCEIIKQNYIELDTLMELSFTSQEIENKMVSFVQHLEDYYEYFRKTFKFKAVFGKSRFIKKLLENNYLLYKVDSYSFANANEEHCSLIYSPLSINFFNLTFSSILKKNFIKKSVSITNETITQVAESIEESIKANLIYCPPFLQKMLTEGFRNMKPCEVFKDILNSMFLNPYHFFIIGFNEMKANDDVIITLKDSLIDYFDKNFKIELFKGETLELLPKNNQFQDFESEISFLSFLRFRDIISQRIGSDGINAEISKHLNNIANLLKIDNRIKPNNQIQKEINKYSKDQIFTLLSNFLQQAIFELIFLKIKSFSSKSIYNLRCYQCIQNHGIKCENKIDIYINNPHEFCKDLMSNYNKKGKGKDDDEVDENELDDILSQSGVQISNDSPIYLIQVLLGGMVFDDFKSKRSSLKLVDQAFENEFFCNFIEDDGSELSKLMKENLNSFNNIVNLFASAFTSSNDPYGKARAISKAYKAIKSKFGHIDDEKLFIRSLFKFSQPPNVISTYVYLYEYLFDSKYDWIFGIIGEDNHITSSRKILESFIYQDQQEFLLKGYYIANCCRICQYHVNLKIGKSEDEIKKIAKFAAIYDQTNENLYKRSFNIFKDNPFEVLNNQDKEKDLKSQFTFRAYDTDITTYHHFIYICHVNDVVDEGFDQIPDRENNFFEFLRKKIKK